MAERKKIALCIEYAIDQFGGTEVLVRELIHSLAERYDLTLVSRDENIGASSVAAKIKQHVSWNPGEISVEKSRQLAKTLSNQGIRLAHFHFGGNYAWGNRYSGKSPILFLTQLGVPCLSTNHGAFSIFDGYCGPQRSWLVKGALFPAAWINKITVLARLKTEIAVSKNDFRALRRWYWPLRAKFGQIYHSRLHESQISAGAPTPMANRNKTIICVGTIGLRKGQVVLARAFSRIAADFPDWKLALIGRHGENDLVATIKKIIADHDLAQKILFLERCSDQEVDQWMKEAAIFAMPSFMEGLGLSLQEALFHGCACIGSAAGGITDLLQNDTNGILVEPGNVEQLAEGLRRLMADEQLRGRLSARGHQSIIEKEMFAEKMVEKYDRLYQRIALKAALTPDIKS